MLDAPRVLLAWAREAPPPDPPKALPPEDGFTDWFPTLAPPRSALDGVARACAPPAPPRSIVEEEGRACPPPAPAPAPARFAEPPPPRSMVDGVACAWLPPRPLPPPYLLAVALLPYGAPPRWFELCCQFDCLLFTLTLFWRL